MELLEQEIPYKETMVFQVMDSASQVNAKQESNGRLILNLVEILTVLRKQAGDMESLAASWPLTANNIVINICFNAIHMLLL